MAKGKKSKAKMSRANHRSWKGPRNKERNKDHEARRVAFYSLRNDLMKQHGLSKADARRKLRELQVSGEVDTALVAN